MLASVPFLILANLNHLTNNHTSDSCARNSSEDMESSADSGGFSESSTKSDGSSVNLTGSQHLLRFPSAASMVAESDMEVKEGKAKELSGSGLMLEENEGENEVSEVVSFMPESPARKSELETHSIQGEPESEVTWTDDKHSSFLNSMEATIVRSLYSQQGLGHLGVYGNSTQIDDSEHDCVESRPLDAYGCCTSYPTKTLGSTLRRTSKSDDLSNLPSTCLPDGIAIPLKEVASAVGASQINMHGIEKDANMMAAITEDNDIEEKQQSGASEDTDNNEIQSCAEVSEIEQGFRLWQNCLQIGGQAVSTPSSRKDKIAWVLKRPPTVDIENVDVFMTKRFKSTHQELAQKDLEMLEQYVAKQRADSVQAAGEHSEQAILEHARKVFETSAEEAGPSSGSEQRDTRKVAGRSAMDQVVPLLGRMDSYESRSSLSFPDLNMPYHLPTGAACVVTEPVSEIRERGVLLSSVPDLNAPLRTSVAPAYTTSQPMINFTKGTEAVATVCSPWPEVGSMEERYFHELAGGAYQPSVQGCRGDDGGNLSLELQTKGLEAGEAFEREPQPSPVSNSRTWTWGVGGFRRRLHEHAAVPASQPSRPLRDGIHLSDPVPFRSSGQQV